MFPQYGIWTWYGKIVATWFSSHSSYLCATNTNRLEQVSESGLVPTGLSEPPMWRPTTGIYAKGGMLALGAQIRGTSESLATTPTHESLAVLVSASTLAG